MEIILWEFHYIFLKHVWPDSQKIGNLIDKKFSGKWDLMADYLANIAIGNARNSSMVPKAWAWEQANITNR